jgi:hypothetical protein
MKVFVTGKTLGENHAFLRHFYNKEKMAHSAIRNP